MGRGPVGKAGPVRQDGTARDKKGQRRGQPDLRNFRRRCNNLQVPISARGQFEVEVSWGWDIRENAGGGQVTMRSGDHNPWSGSQGTREKQGKERGRRQLELTLANVHRKRDNGKQRDAGLTRGLASEVMDLR